jgi:hypothetical protein
MQPFRFPPYVLAIILIATLLLFLAGLAVSNVGINGSQPVAPGRLLPQAR